MRGKRPERAWEVVTPNGGYAGNDRRAARSASSSGVQRVSSERVGCRLAGAPTTETEQPTFCKGCWIPFATISNARNAEGTQSPGETLRSRSGTCRDYAWLMVEALRRLGFASAVIFTTPRWIVVGWA
jgi:Transglutaminase-like superfamily